MATRKVSISTLVSISVVAVALALGLAGTGCGGSESRSVMGDTAVRVIPTLVGENAGEMDGSAGGADAQDVMVDNFESLVERREHLQQTIEAIPTPTVPPTPDLAQLAAAQILGGGDSNTPVDDTGLIPDPQSGIWWYRDSPGDWTDSGTRERNPYSPLFDTSSLETHHPSFAYGSMQEKIARTMAEEAVKLMPELEGYGTQLVEPLRRNFGWEIAGEELPVARVWSSFTYSGPLDSRPRRYRLGGAMLFQVRDYLESNTGDLIYQYLDAGYFLGKGMLMEDEGPIQEIRRRR